MASRGDRFRHLRTPGTGDLFEHFGIATEAETADEASDTAPVAAAACNHCAWLRPLPLQSACPLCGGPGVKEAG